MNSENKKNGLTKTQKRRFRRKQQTELKKKIRELEEKYNVQIDRKDHTIDISFKESPGNILRVIYKIASDFYSLEKRLRFFLKDIYSRRYTLQIEELDQSFWYSRPIEIDHQILKMLQTSLDMRCSLEKCDFQSCRNLVYNDDSSIKFTTCNDCSLEEFEEAFSY